MSLQERDFFNERPETKPVSFACPTCRHRDEYYMMRVSDAIVCKRGRRKFDLPSQQPIASI